MATAFSPDIDVRIFRRGKPNGIAFSSRYPSLPLPESNRIEVGRHPSQVYRIKAGPLVNEQDGQQFRKVVYVRAFNSGRPIFAVA